MSTHQHPHSRARLSQHKRDVRAVERTTAATLDDLWRPARSVCLGHVDALLGQMQQEEKRLAQLARYQVADDPGEDDEEEDDARPHVTLSWLDGPQARLLVLCARIEHAVGVFASAAGEQITTAHQRMTVEGAAAAAHVLALRNPDDPGSVQMLPPGQMAQMAGRAGNGQPVANLLHGVGRDTADKVGRVLRVGVTTDLRALAMRSAVVQVLETARDRAQTVLTDSLWRGTGDVMMAVYRANGREAS